ERVPGTRRLFRNHYTRGADHVHAEVRRRSRRGIQCQHHCPRPIPERQYGRENRERESERRTQRGRSRENPEIGTRQNIIWLKWLCRGAGRLPEQNIIWNDGGGSQAVEGLTRCAKK